MRISNANRRKNWSSKFLPAFVTDSASAWRAWEGRAAAAGRRTALQLGPHVAALGLEFYTGRMFPPEYQGQLFIAEHGSWNRSNKIGYRVMLVTFEDGTWTGATPGGLIRGPQRAELAEAAE